MKGGRIVYNESASRDAPRDGTDFESSSFNPARDKVMFYFTQFTRLDRKQKQFYDLSYDSELEDVLRKQLPPPICRS